MTVSTMPRIRIPKSVAERTIGDGGGAFAWPVAIYEGTIRQVRRRNLGEAMEGSNTPWAGYASFDVDTLSVELKPISVLDGDGSTSVEEIQERIGERPFFLGLDSRNGFVLQDGNHDFSNTDPDERDVEHWRLQQSMTLFTQLAVALGQVEEDGDDLVIASDFIDNLESGQFTGTNVIFRVGNRKSKDRVFDFVAEILPS